MTWSDNAASFWMGFKRVGKYTNDEYFTYKQALIMSFAHSTQSVITSHESYPTWRQFKY